MRASDGGIFSTILMQLSGQWLHLVRWGCERDEKWCRSLALLRPHDQWMSVLPPIAFRLSSRGIDVFSVHYPGAADHSPDNVDQCVRTMLRISQ